MMRARFVLVAALTVAGLVLALSPEPAPREPFCCTFSICAYDPEKQEWGVAVASKYLAVGAVVPHAQVEAGAVATQSFVNVKLGPDGLKLLAQGKNAQETIDALLATDAGKDQRQLGVVDKVGRVAHFTGKGCIPWAGAKAGQHFTCQGNLLAGPQVVDEMARAFAATQGPLAWRLMAALDAGDKAGGDKRGKQSAALLVVRHRGGPLGMSDRYLDFRVDDHQDPIPELARILSLRLRRPQPMKP